MLSFKDLLCLSLLWPSTVSCCRTKICPVFLFSNRQLLTVYCYRSRFLSSFLFSYPYLFNVYCYRSKIFSSFSSPTLNCRLFNVIDLGFSLHFSSPTLSCSLFTVIVLGFSLFISSNPQLFNVYCYRSRISLLL